MTDPKQQPGQSDGERRPKRMPSPHIKPRRTVLSNVVFSLPGGNEDNDLWLWREEAEDGVRLRSCWVPNDEQRQAIADGANIELFIWGSGMPPVGLALCNYPLGAPRDVE